MTISLTDTFSPPNEANLLMADPFLRPFGIGLRRVKLRMHKTDVKTLAISRGFW
jgi:hypothetical protein